MAHETALAADPMLSGVASQAPAAPAGILPIGRAPRPTTGDDFAQRLSLALADLMRPFVANTDRLGARAVLDGADVAGLDIDGSGLAVSGSAVRRALDAEPAATPSVRPEAALGEPAEVRSGRLVASPLFVAGIAADLRAEVDALPFAWVDTGDGTALADVEPGAGRPMPTGHVRLAVGRQALIDGVHRIATRVLAPRGLRPTDIDIEITARGPRSAVVDASARIKAGVLAASARVGVTLSVDDANMLRVADVTVTSRNPLVAAVLPAVRRRLDRIGDAGVDLAAMLAPRLRLVDVRLEVGETLAVTGTFG